MARGRLRPGAGPARRVAGWLLALASLCFAQTQPRKSPPPPAVEILEILAQRSERLLTIDGRLRNSGGRALEGLELVFDMMASDGQVITRQRGAVEPDPLEPGEEAEFRWQMRDHARAVSLRVRAGDRSGKEVPVKNAGPHAIH